MIWRQLYPILDFLFSTKNTVRTSLVDSVPSIGLPSRDKAPQKRAKTQAHPMAVDTWMKFDEPINQSIAFRSGLRISAFC